MNPGRLGAAVGVLAVAVAGTLLLHGRAAPGQAAGNGTDAPARAGAETTRGQEDSMTGATEREPGPADRDAADGLARATFAGGCFWCMEPPFDELDGVVSTTSGYAGGHVEDPTYEQVSSGGTGHREVVQVTYDPEEVGYETLLHVFWRNVDPTDDGGQFCDRGHQYTTAIFYHDDRQRQLAEASKARLQRSGRFDEPLVTPVLPLDAFYPAEDYHQDYYREHSLRYKFYRYRCGRDRVLERLWGEEAGGQPPPPSAAG